MSNLNFCAQSEQNYTCSLIFEIYSTYVARNIICKWNFLSDFQTVCMYDCSSQNIWLILRVCLQNADIYEN